MCVCVNLIRFRLAGLEGYRGRAGHPGALLQHLHAPFAIPDGPGPGGAADTVQLQPWKLLQPLSLLRLL